MVQAGQFYRVQQGEILMTQGQQATWFYCLLAGRAQVISFLPNGKAFTINTFTAPCILGELELIDPTEIAMQVQVTEKGVVFAIDMTTARTIGMNNIAFLQKLCITVCRKERQATKKLLTSQGFPAQIRLADFILEHSNNRVFSLTKTDTAQILGVSYRHMEKLFSDFVADGILKKEKRRYTILQPHTLQQLADHIKR